MGDTNFTKEEDNKSNVSSEDSACLSAMVLTTNLVYPAVLNAAVHLNLFEIISNATPPGAFISPSQIASHLPSSTQHSDLSNRLDRMLRLLTSYSLLTSSTRTAHNGSTEIVYGLSSVGKYLVPDETRGYLASFTTFLCIHHVGGDMFQSVPQGDAIILKAVCHNWSDHKCIQFLTICHKALSPNGKVILVEFILPEQPTSTQESKLVSTLDNLMFITVGGRERTEKQYQNLGKLSGFSKFHVACRAFSCLGVIELYK
ncbi:hypothetical protein RYX36_020486 [Vicia faba]